MPIGDIIKNIFVGKGADLVDSIKGLVDESKLSAEEKMEFEAKAAEAINKHNEAMANLAQQELEANLRDVQSARDANARIQEAEKASWLSKNVGYILDISVGVFFYVMLFMIFFHQVPEANKELFYTAFGVLASKYGSSFDFHRGSSAGSKASNEVIRNIVKNKT